MAAARPLPIDHLARFGLLEVQADAALAAVEVQVDRPHARLEVRAHLAHDVALGRLELDHVGAVLRQHLGRERTHDDAGEVEDQSTDTRPARALLEAGSGRLAALCYGLLPHTARELASYTVYRWECAVRASVVMGFVGAGGLGQLMDQSMKMLNGGEASSILLVFLLLVLLADAMSNALRRLLA